MISYVKESDILVNITQEEIEQEIIILPFFSADYTELPENDIIRSVRRYSINTEIELAKTLNTNPADFIAAILNPKKNSNYFFLFFVKISEEKNFLHLFSLF